MLKYLYRRRAIYLLCFMQCLAPRVVSGTSVDQNNA